MSSQAPTIFSQTQLKSLHTQAPLPPLYFEPQLGTMTRLTKMLSSYEGPNIVLLHGKRGVGKTTLVAKLARDFKNSFSVILWANLGKTPNLLGKLAGWMLELGECNFATADLEEATKRLFNVLAKRSYLLIINDVRKTNKIEQFLKLVQNLLPTSGRRHKVIITTCDERIVQDFSFSSLSLETWTESTALSWLKKRFGQSLRESEQDKASALVKKLHGLPWALNLICPHLASGTTWDELLDLFQTEMHNSEALLKICFRQSSRLLEKKDTEGLFKLGILSEWATIYPATVALVWNVSEEVAQGRLQHYVDQSLMYRTDKGYLLHPLLRSYALDSLKDDRGTMAGAHRRLVQSYRSRAGDSDKWSTVPDDGYIFDHLIWHLSEGGSLQKAHELLRDKEWMQVRKKRKGTYFHFLNDVAQAWRLAEKEGSTQVGTQVRYALMQASIKSLTENSTNIPAEFLVRLVENKRWSADRALTHIMEISDDEQRLGTLQLLKSILSLDELKEALEKATDDIQMTLIAHIENSNRDSQWQKYLNTLNELASSLPDHLLKDVLDATRNLTRSPQKVWALKGLAPLLRGPDLLDQALDIVEDIHGESNRADILVELAPNLSADSAAKAAEIARRIKSGKCRTRALVCLIPKLPHDQKKDTIAKVQESLDISDQRDRDAALRSLAPYLSPDSLRQIFDDICSRYEKKDAVHHDIKYDLKSALSELAPYLSRAKRQREALEAVQNLIPEHFSSYRAKVILSLFPHLKSDELREFALRLALKLSASKERADVLASLAPHLSGNLPRLALNAVDDLEGTERAEVLTALAPSLPDDLLPFALSIARAIEQEGNCAHALIGLIPHLTSETTKLNVIVETLGVADNARSDRVRAEILTDLAPLLPSKLIARAFDIAVKISTERNRSNALVGIAPRLQSITLFAQALDAAAKIENETDRIDALMGLAARLPRVPSDDTEMLNQALPVIKNIESNQKRAVAIAALAPRLPLNARNRVLEQELDAVRAIADQGERTISIASLVNLLSGELLEQALDDACQIGDETNCAVALESLAPRLRDDRLISKADRRAHEIKDESLRIRVLVKLAPNIVGHKQKTILDESLETHTDADRRAMLPRSKQKAILEESLETISRMLDKGSMSDKDFCANALKELAECLSGFSSLSSRAIMIARRLPETGQSGNLRAQTFKELARAFSKTGHWEEILNETQSSIDWKSHRVSFLASLPDELLSGDLLTTALDQACDTDDSSKRAKELKKLVKTWTRPLCAEHQNALVGTTLEKSLLGIRERLLKIFERIDEEELRDYSYRLNVDFDDLRGEGKSGKARELLLYLENRNRLSELIEIGKRQRPDISWPAIPKTIDYELWPKTLRKLARRTRKDLLSDIRALVPVIEELGGKTAIEEVAQAIRDVGEWWS